MAAFGALALGPLLGGALRLAEALGEKRTVQHQLAGVIDPFVGHGAVRALDGVVRRGDAAANGLLAEVLAVAVALFAGSRLFYALQRALHVMWRTPLRGATALGSTIASFFAAGVLSVCVIGGLTAVIFGSAAFAAAARGASVHGGLATLGVRVGVAVLGALVLAPVVAALFRWLPGVHLTWGDVWIGALTTTIGFAGAQLAIGTYLQFVDLPWTYGSAASVVVVLLWLYYSSYVFLLGAEFTMVYAREAGSLRARAPGPSGSSPPS